MFGFFNRRPDAPFEPFVGVGTVFLSDVRNLSAPSEGFDPAQLAKAITIHLSHVENAILKHRGRVLQHLGDAVLAFWPPEIPSHAQLAYEAARTAICTLPKSLQKQSGLKYSLQIALGTSEMAGDFFGPTRQFQIIGKARAIVERMTSVNISNKSCILFSQYTREVIRTKDTVEEIEIGRAHV